MTRQWETCAQELRSFVNDLLSDAGKVINEEIIGCYLHGSLAMGGFNPNRSDIDLIVVTKHAMSVETKRNLVQLFLKRSKRPFPVEISILTLSQLEKWQYPTPYDFHYSEFWRKRYENELQNGTTLYLNKEEKRDVDLAAHFVILHQRGICLSGRPIHLVFPEVPEPDYLTSIMEDYEECLQNILQKPVYCILNFLRVYWYLADGTISSKQEAGIWGAVHLPKEFQPVIEQAVKGYSEKNAKVVFNETDLVKLSVYIDHHIKEMMKERSLK